MKFVSIGGIADVVSKGTTPTSVGLSFENRGVAFLRAEDVGNDYAIPESAVKFITEDAHHILNRSALQDGDILVSIAGTIGRCSVFKSGGGSANCNQAVAFIRLGGNKYDPYWVSCLLKSPKYQALFDSFVAGGAIPNVSLTQLRSIQIPDVGLDEQVNTAKSLKTLLKLSLKAAEATRLQREEIGSLRDSLIYDSLKGHRKVTTCLGDVLDEIKRGIGETWNEYRVLGATRNGLSLAREQPGKTPQRYKPVTVGTVFYNPMRIMIGSIAFVDEDDEPGITSPDYVVLKGKEGIVDSRWFYYWLRSPLGEAYIQSLARGAVRERMLFNRLSEGEIELPDYKTQLKASKALAEIKPMQTAIENQLKDLELIPLKLLSQIFGS